ncbi:MAG: hypothetical protein KUL77_12075 [Thermomonas sp.]|uniref:hypothetical protein n=1 Tax=Thermomonas sp. TaxID=1971895 RepID=UPI001EC1D737|nr:hypothetical protein [Thermomonas sp.]MBV2210285.1 hypothetical protein [Thermomonas sp.]
MIEPTLVMHCLASDFDAVTNACAAPFWSVASSFPPPMSIEDSLLISSAIGVLWGIGHMIRQSRRAAASG